jgi:uncharacterized protein DUF6966
MSYRDALAALQLLLDRIGETQWRDWIAQDLEEWDAKRSVTHHLSAYGTMGSLSDLYLSAKVYKIPPGKEPWVQALFENLRSICDSLASSPRLLSSIESVVTRVGTWRQLRLRGSKCRSCGHVETTPLEIETFLAHQEMRPAALGALKQGRLPELVQRVLSPEVGWEAQRESVVRKVKASGIEIRAREGWTKPCPKCGSGETEVTYWTLQGDRFSPT